MRIPRIYTPAPLALGDHFTIDGAAANHMLKVLRMEVGRQVVLFNGKGAEYPSTIISTQKKSLVLEINTEVIRSAESPLQIHLGQAISRGDRMDYSIQKAVELGVIDITPIFSQRSEMKLKGDRLEKKMQHWEGVIIAACEQCGRNKLPKLHPPKTVQQWGDELSCDLKLVLHHRAVTDLNSFNQPQSTALLIGPEGGLTDIEIDAAEHSGFSSVLFGPRILRTETAALCAISVLQAKWGDF